ncbi:hypothetical protein SAMN05892883_1154 [Jatrophihabitans sp. GAS493]|nr:hypothetical protein SAMN05892883_1154 [Jatrophihabitans sp. GAS493]
MTRFGSFDKLPTRTKQEVFDLAREGRLHPDPGVASLSLTWADDYVNRATPTRIALWSVINVLLLAIGPTSADYTVTQWRAARSIVRISGGASP